jgi:hypothetical protein
MPQPLFDDNTPLRDVLRNPRGLALIQQRLPELLSAPMLGDLLYQYPLGLVVASEPSLHDRPETVRSILDDFASLRPTEQDRVSSPDSGGVFRTPEPTPRRHSMSEARTTAQYPSAVAQWDRFEVVLQGPSDGLPFVEVDLSAEFTGGRVVPGFYDGDGVFRIRLMPPTPGRWHFRTRSNIPAMDGIQGEFAVTTADVGIHGPVRVAKTYHFAFADGTPYRPIGTTAYAWTHQEAALQEQTLGTLARSPFNKVRMCVFPKSYRYNANEPQLYPFEGSPTTGWDFTRFNVRFFRHLEDQVTRLAELGIEADLILFHAYDRWGFSRMDPATDDRYVRYLVARLASHRNVWWSLANEYDLLDKTPEDWERWAALVQADDPSDHLMSIHNCRGFYDHSRQWITHASIQRTDVYRTAEETTVWRDIWHKPVVIDECGYEGDMDLGWGNLTGQEMVRRHWEGFIRGGYVGHGETYLDEHDIIFWSKGGELKGTSPERIAFLRRILEEGPMHGLEPATIDWDVPRAGVEGTYYLYYFGANQPRFRQFVLDPATEYQVDVIDTWAMTITELEGTYTGRFRIELPGRSFMAVRMRAVGNSAPPTT